MRAVNWKYQAAASPGLNGRSMYWPRGRVVGGSSSINAWCTAAGCRPISTTGATWAMPAGAGTMCGPISRRSERRVDADGPGARREGPLDVKDVTPFLHPMRREWLEAAAELGFPVTDDFNGPQPEGFGCYQVTIRDGRRWSAADAFLRPALKRGNVRLETGAWASKLRCEGRRVLGVEYVRDNERALCRGRPRSDRVRRRGQLAAAAAALGHRPGAGCSREHGIATVLDNPAVGGNLQDHLAVVYSFKATRPTLNDELHSRLRPDDRGRALSADAARSLEPLSVNQFGGFVRANPQALAARRAAVFQSGDLSGGRCDAHAHRGRRRSPDSICAFSRPGRPAPAASTSRARDFRAPRASRRTICPPTKTSRTSCTAAGCCRRSRARGRSRA